MMIQEKILLIISKKRKKEIWIFFFLSSSETAGEQDHSTYDLRVLKIPIYTLNDGNTILNNDRSSTNNQDKYRFK